MDGVSPTIDFASVVLLDRAPAFCSLTTARRLWVLVAQTSATIRKG